MKKLILLGLIAVTFAACNTTPKAIGYEVGDDGVKIPLYSGDLSNADIWEKYIIAHNERDLKTISSLNAEKDFKVYGPTGVVFFSVGCAH